MNKEEIFYTMALTRLTNFNYQQALELYRMVGSAQLLYEYRSHRRVFSQTGRGPEELG
ncbi:hypothetical protein [Puniceibacterium confluentis]|uniref:hypothetical protein n=1 Tax=Puniceibacterium confluentis TaxID=1958944 RepID=UPI0016449593|nr:hypothetical protein [Puniceibacterium confluentis]